MTMLTFICHKVAPSRNHNIKKLVNLVESKLYFWTLLLNFIKFYTLNSSSKIWADYNIFSSANLKDVQKGTFIKNTIYQGFVQCCEILTGYKIIFFNGLKPYIYIKKMTMTMTNDTLFRWRRSRRWGCYWSRNRYTNVFD